ncbi:MFS transporter [Micrococcoides hystricis]|uniref:MFS transporter n=1 Tax=Micrococcoides hystricis TaxID=1572761 RepID=A0ABV6P7U1_9MICC
MTRELVEQPLVSDRASAKTWLGFAALMLTVLLISIDNTVLSFALPDISKALNPSGTQLLWIVDIYPLILAGLLITMGTVGDRVGRKKLLLIGAIGFGAVSVFAAFAASAEQLIVARALLGLFGATLMPSTLALLRNMFQDPIQRRLAVAIWAAGFSAGAALGPIVGGWLLEHFWWGSIFLINVPVIALFLVLAPLLLPESKDPSPGKLDLISAAISIGAMFLIVFGIKSVAAGDNLLIAIGLFAAGVILSWNFVRRQLRIPNPMLDVRLFVNRVFSVSVVANLLSLMALTGMLYYISQYLQLVLGYSPMGASMYLIPGLVATILAGLIAVKLANRFPLRALIPLGLLMSAGGFVVGAQLQAGSSVWLLVVAFVLVGMGVGLAETLTNDAILSSVPPHKAGAASGISETAYEVGALLGTAVLGSILTAVYRYTLHVPVGINKELGLQAQETLGAAIQISERIPAIVGEELASNAREAFTLGADAASIVGAIAVTIAGILVFMVLRRQRSVVLEPEREP